MGNQASNLQQLNQIKQDITNLYPESDIDGDGLLNQEEFTEFLKNFLEIRGFAFPTEDKIKTLLTTNDGDKDGKLSYADIEKMLLPEGHENMTYDPNNQSPQPDPSFNPIAKLISAFGPPIKPPVSAQPVQNGAPVQPFGGFPNQQLGQNPVQTSPPNPLNLIANLTQSAQSNEPQPVQNFMNTLMGGIGKAFQELGLPGMPGPSNNQAPGISSGGFLSSITNTATNMLSMAAEMTFDIVDLDEDGFIGFDDLQALMNEKAELHGLPPYETEQIQDQMDRYDQDKDGKLNLEEYKVMMRKGSNFFLNKPVDFQLGI